MAGGGISDLTCQTFCPFPAGLTGFLSEIPPDHIQVIIGCPLSPHEAFIEILGLETRMMHFEFLSRKLIFINLL